MTKKLVFVLMLVLSACEDPHPAQSTTMASHSLTVERIGEVDGCTIYRFYDLGYHRYFVRCANVVTLGDGEVHTRSTGKTIYTETIPQSITTTDIK